MKRYDTSSKSGERSVMFRGGALLESDQWIVEILAIADDHCKDAHLHSVTLNASRFLG